MQVTPQLAQQQHWNPAFRSFPLSSSLWIKSGSGSTAESKWSRSHFCDSWRAFAETIPANPSSTFILNPQLPHATHSADNGAAKINQCSLTKGTIFLATTLIDWYHSRSKMLCTILSCSFNQSQYQTAIESLWKLEKQRFHSESLVPITYRDLGFKRGCNTAMLGEKIIQTCWSCRETCRQLRIFTGPGFCYIDLSESFV